MHNILTCYSLNLQSKIIIACKIINLAVRGCIARVTVVCQCVCLLPGQMALNCFNSVNKALVATVTNGKTSVLLKNTAKRSVKRIKSFKSLNNL